MERSERVTVLGAATSADLPDVACVLGEAFEDDPVIVSIVGPGAARRERATHLFNALLRAEHGNGVVVDVARDTSGALLGAAVWEEPDGQGASLPALFAQAGTFVRAVGVLGIPRALATRSALARYRPGRPHWYLGQIGVASSVRGTGVGSHLLAHRLRQVDDSCAGSYLESSTERNRALYLRHGFASHGVIEGVPDAAPVAMWRAPVGVRA